MTLQMNTSEQTARFFSGSENFRGSVKSNENLAKHTTMHTGGDARIFLEPEDEESLIFSLQKFTEEKIKFFVLGGGSNVVISDRGLDAVISTRKLNKVTANGNTLETGAGSSWGGIISFCRKNNLGGFESFTGLSGTTGGAVFMNASCFGLSASDNLLSVRYFDFIDNKIHEYLKNDSDWGYKKSPFQPRGGVTGVSPVRGGSEQRSANEGEASPLKIILSVKFSVTQGFDSEKSEKCIAERKEKGHFLAPSSGSAFKNDPDRGIIAGKLIDECGLKGFSSGNAKIAPWHGNFIINPEQKATAQDIKKLSDTVRQIVREKTGIELESEILFVGEEFTENKVK